MLNEHVFDLVFFRKNEIRVENVGVNMIQQPIFKIFVFSAFYFILVLELRFLRFKRYIQPKESTNACFC